MSWKKKMLPVAIALAISVPTVAFAAEPAAPVADQKKQTESGVKGHKEDDKKRKVYSVHRKMLEVHKQMYFTLLSDKYTPELSAQWKTAFAERNQLKEQWKALKKEQKEVKSKKKSKNKSKNKQQYSEEMKQKCETYKQFTAAIKANDEAQIKLIMPKMLEHYKQMNVKMSQKLQEMKKKTS